LSSEQEVASLEQDSLSTTTDATDNPYNGDGKSAMSDSKNDNNVNIEEISKLAKIAEIMELLEETNRNKDWLTQHIKLKRQKVAINPTMTTVGILKVCEPEFISYLLGELNADEDNFETPPALTKTYHWFFTDIVASSDPTMATNEQATKIMLLNKLIEKTETFKQRDPENTLILPTGDGMAMGFTDSPEKPFRLALEVHKGLNRYNQQRKEIDKVLIRIGLDSGPVYLIKDLNGNENVWGPGIIMARRVMDLARDMNILATARFANDVRTLRPEYRKYMHPIGDYKIKHGEKILIYNIYGDNIGSKKVPSPDKKQQSKADEEVLKTSSRFLFNHVGVELDILDPKTMLTHHTMIWNMVNISNDPIERIFYYLDGDSPKPFPDMNVIIKDEEDRELDIMSLNVNKPYHKEFFVRLKKPLKPNEKKVVKIEWDWEEPERMYMHRFASDCKKFSFMLTAPKEVEVTHKVVRVDTETGEKLFSTIPAIVKREPDKTIVTWEAPNLRTFDAYRFDW
jgi:hypothetical protein